MKISREQYQNSILLLANEIEMIKTYESILEIIKGFPKISEMIVYDLFVNDYENYIQKDNDVFEAYYHLKDYCKELKEKGFVEFKQ